MHEHGKNSSANCAANAQFLVCQVQWNWYFDIDNDGLLDIIYCHGTNEKKRTLLTDYRSTILPVTFQ